MILSNTEVKSSYMFCSLCRNTNLCNRTYTCPSYFDKLLHFCTVGICIRRCLNRYRPKINTFLATILKPNAYNIKGFAKCFIKP